MVQPPHSPDHVWRCFWDIRAVNQSLSPAINLRGVSTALQFLHREIWCHQGRTQAMQSRVVNTWARKVRAPQENSDPRLQSPLAISTTILKAL